MLFAEIIVYAVFVYLGCGMLFALWFVMAGITKLDAGAKGTGAAFRFLIFFGATAFWVLLAWRLAKGETRPAEKTAHRAEASK